MKTSVYAGNMLSIAFFLCFALMWPMTSCVHNSETTQNQLMVKADTVKVSGNAATLEFPGKVTAAKEVNMAFQVAGKLEKIYVQDGASVEMGQLIASLDDRDYRTQLNAAEAEYNSIRAEAGRVTRLYEEKATSAANYDKARYGLQQITAKYENCKNQLADTKIYAPFSGRIQKHYYDAPAIVGAGMPVVCLVADGTREIEINVPAKEYKNIGSNCRFEAVFSFLQGNDIELRYLSTSPKANSNQLYTVRLAIGGNQRNIAPGMNAIVKVHRTNTAVHSVSINTTSLFSKEGRTFVWKIVDGKAEMQEVSVDRFTSGGSAVISAGLSEGDVIVTAGVHKITEGQSVSMIPDASKSNVGGLL